MMNKLAFLEGYMEKQSRAQVADPVVKGLRDALRSLFTQAKSLKGVKLKKTRSDIKTVQDQLSAYLNKPKVVGAPKSLAPVAAPTAAPAAQVAGAAVKPTRLTPGQINKGRLSLVEAVKAYRGQMADQNLSKYLWAGGAGLGGLGAGYVGSQMMNA